MGRSFNLAAPVHLVKGSDESLRNEAVVDLVGQLVGDGDRGLMVDEFAGADLDLAGPVAAAQTPTFITERRVVLVRNAAQFSKADDVTPLISYLADPLETTSLVLVWEVASSEARTSPVPKKLSEAIAAAGGEIISVDVGSGKSAQSAWWKEQLAASPVKLDARAVDLVKDALGDEVGRLPGLLAKLAATYGPDSKLGVDEVEPYLGKAGVVPPWDLTDAIDAGDTSRALDLLRRMLDGGARHPLQLMATLHTHYGRMLSLDGAGVGDERKAAELLGMKGSTFPAKKALNQARALGHDGVARSISLLAEADLALRGGGRSWPGELVLEVLVARLSRLGGRRGVSRPRGR